MSSLAHDVKIEGNGASGGTDQITDSSTSATVDLQPGTYTFFCSVDGHRAAGWRARSPSSSLGPVLIDLQHLGRSRVIASYLLAEGEPALVDCGPSSCLDALEAGLADRGVAIEDLRDLLLTHIHLDHAGAAGALVRRNPGSACTSARSARRISSTRAGSRRARAALRRTTSTGSGASSAPFRRRTSIVGGESLGDRGVADAGHASHHVSYLRGRDVLLGDVTGVVIAPSTLIAPVCPPPDVDLEAWERSLDSIAERRPERLCLPHFGVVEDPAHIERTRERLRTWASACRDGASEEEFVRAAEQELEAGADPDTAAAYTQAGPLWQSTRASCATWPRRGKRGRGCATL
jgi:glyoxylase-like metal-dependent hydrolase (beta-lactamase superfamily II)